MISLGPELATDLFGLDSAQPAVPPSSGGAALHGAPNVDLFNAVLGQMIGEGDVAVDAEASSDAASGAVSEDESAATVDLDSNELSNPILAEHAAPVAPPVPTMVWSIAAVPAKVTATISVDVPTSMPDALVSANDQSQTVQAHVAAGAGLLASVLTSEPAEGIDTPAAVDVPAVKRETQWGASAARSESLPVGIEMAAAVPAETIQADAMPQRDHQARSEFAPQIAEAINKDDLTQRKAKNEKAPSEPKIDAAGIRPLPFTAVERAYAGNEQGGSKSFEAPKEQAQPFAAAGSQSASHPSGAPSFAVPIDGRSLLNVPAAVMRDAVEIPAQIARDIDTNVPPQIVQSIRLQANNGGGEAIIRLNPDYLGEVVVAVKVEQGSVTAALQAETPAVRQWVERNESVLRQALAEQGLHLDKLTVAEKTSETEREGAHDDAREDAREEDSRQQQPRRRRPQSDEATFEVTV